MASRKIFALSVSLLYAVNITGLISLCRRYFCSTRASHRYGRLIFSQGSSTSTVATILVLVCFAGTYSDWYTWFHRGCSFRSDAIQGVPRFRGTGHLWSETGRTLQGRPTICKRTIRHILILVLMFGTTELETSPSPRFANDTGA